jgi:cell division protein FtsI/penicillin-binding protein 2
MLGRASAVIVAGALVGVGLVHGGAGSPEPTVYRFLLDWEQGHYRQAAALTTGQPAAVATELSSAYGQLDATDLVLTMNHVSQQGGTATAVFNASIDLGSTGLVWKYSNSFSLLESGSAWRVVWTPSVIARGLTGKDRLAVVQEPSDRAQLLAASGQPLTVPSLTYEIGVIPASLKDTAEVQEIADGLAAVFHLQVQANQIAGDIRALPSGFHELITLTPSQYDSVRASLAHIHGLTIKPVRERLFRSVAPDVVGQVGTETAQVLRIGGVQYRPGTTVGLSGLQLTYQHQLTGTPTIGVVIENAQGVALQYVKQWPGARGKPVSTTLQYNVQAAANTALSQVPNSAAIVAVQASTGKILAVASQTGSKMPRLDPLDGSYEPGQAFTMISSAAILSSIPQMSPSAVTPCPASNKVDGRNFVNVPPETGIGQTPPFSKDFADACSTAFAGLSERLSAADLTGAVDEFGIGAPWLLPVSAFSGNVGQPSGLIQVAADVVGQGDVRVSPLAMALAAGVADTGRWHAPSLVTGQPDPSASVRGVMKAQVLSDLQGLMRQAAQHSLAPAADAGKDVYGQTGVAPFSSQLRISWFVGFQGDIAFAVAELVSSPSTSAAPLAGSFLGNIHTGS